MLFDEFGDPAWLFTGIDTVQDPGAFELIVVIVNEVGGEATVQV